MWTKIFFENTFRNYRTNNILTERQQKFYSQCNPSVKTSIGSMMEKNKNLVKVEGELESLDKSIKKRNFGIFRFISILIQGAMRRKFQEISPLQL